MAWLRILLIVPLLGAAAPSPVEDAALGLRLADYARRTGDARMMLSAARIVAASGLREASLADGQLVPRERLPDISPLVTGMTDEARLLAPGDAEVSAQADAIAKARPKGVIGGSWGSGPLQYRHVLPAGQRIGWTLMVRGVEPVLISAIGDGDADLHLSVADDRGRTVCDARASAYYPLCRWSPPHPARYRIALDNAGKVPTQVVVLSN